MLSYQKSAAREDTTRKKSWKRAHEGDHKCRDGREPVYETLKACGNELAAMLMLSSMPVAVRLLGKEDTIPEGARRPLKDMGCHLSLCQALALSRREGQVIAMLKEDNWCPYPVIGLGLAETPAYFLEGKGTMPGIRSRQGSKKWAQAYPRLDSGKYIGVISAPLRMAQFDPDVVMLYVNSAQLGRILLALSYEEGQEIAPRLCSDAACSYYIVPVVKGAEAYVSVPCVGDRRRALAADDELVFSLAPGNVTSLAMNLRKLGEAGIGFPHPPDMPLECPQPAPYQTLAGLLGMASEE